MQFYYPSLTTSEDLDTTEEHQHTIYSLGNCPQIDKLNEASSTLLR